jgi:hypothetical protein
MILLAKPEIRESYVSVTCNKYVLWLHVAVHNLLAMQIFNGEHKLRDDEASGVLGETFLNDNNLR